MRALLLLPLLFACSATSPDRPWKAPEHRVGRINTSIGGLSFQETDDWGPGEDQIIVGFDWAELTDLPVMLEGGIHYSYDDVRFVNTIGDRIKVRESLWTFSFGALYAPFEGEYLVRPYVGAGGVFGIVDFGDDDDEHLFEDRDTTLGAYFKLGVLFEFYAGGSVGFEYRLFGGRDVEINGVDLDPSYQSLAVVFGTSLGN